jgi:hypothetical protein
MPRLGGRIVEDAVAVLHCPRWWVFIVILGKIPG